MAATTEENDRIAREVARRKIAKHFRADLADHEEYQFSVFMLVLAHMHHALTKYKLENPDFPTEMKNCSTIIREEMIAAGFVIQEEQAEYEHPARKVSI